MEAPWVVGEGILDGDHVVLDMNPLPLTGRAEIVVGTNEAFVAGTIDGATAAIADHSRVEWILAL